MKRKIIISAMIFAVLFGSIANVTEKNKTTSVATNIELSKESKQELNRENNTIKNIVDLTSNINIMTAYADTEAKINFATETAKINFATETAKINQNLNVELPIEESNNEVSPSLLTGKSFITKEDYIKYKPNEIAEIMMIMYHGLKEDKNRAAFQTTAAAFKNDLQLLYDNNYRLISTEQLINDDFDLPCGMTPVLLSFDDGDSTAFSFTEVDGKLVPTENCAVDIINKFAESHPDFGKTAIFNIYQTPYTFNGAGTMEERLRYLVDNGYEIGNHTNDHVSLRTLDALGVQREVGELDKYIKSILPDYTIKSITYPFGERPIEKLRGLAINGGYNDYNYSYALGIREGQSGASAAIHNIDFDPINFPRVRGTHNANTDLGWQLKKYKEKPWLKYVSDGSVNRISVPREWENKINMDSIGDKELYVYDAE